LNDRGVTDAYNPRRFSKLDQYDAPGYNAQGEASGFERPRLSAAVNGLGGNGGSIVNQSLQNVSPLNMGTMPGNQNSLTKVSSSRKLEGTGL
jgi:hypothetical protein